MCFFASCFVSCRFFVLHLLLALLMFRAFHLASFLVLCCCYLQWCVISRLALLLFVLVHRPHLVLLLLVVVLCFVFFLFVVVLCFPLLLLVVVPHTLHYHCLMWFLAFCCHFLLWSFTLHYSCLLWSLALCYCCLLCPSPCIITICCGFSSPCFVVPHIFPNIHLTFPCCYYLLWFVTLHLALLLLVCQGDVLPPLLPCVGFGAWSWRCCLRKIK